MSDELHSTNPHAQTRSCPACGEAARRAEARFCSACGRSLDESYLPADALRATYNSQYGRLANRRSEGRAGVKPPKNSMSMVSIAQQKSNGASATALAFVTYALVPYLGILFCPGALVAGGLGLYKSYSVPERGGRRASYISITLGLLIFCGQLLLWWVLYKIPQWAGRF